MACMGANDGHLHLLPRRPSKIKVMVNEISENYSSVPRLPTKVDVDVFKFSLIFINRVGVPKAFHPQTKCRKHTIKQHITNGTKLMVHKNICSAACSGGSCSKSIVSFCVFESQFVFVLANAWYYPTTQHIYFLKQQQQKQQHKREQQR